MNQTVSIQNSAKRNCETAMQTRRTRRVGGLTCGIAMVDMGITDYCIQFGGIYL